MLEKRQMRQMLKSQTRRIMLLLFSQKKRVFFTSFGGIYNNRIFIDRMKKFLK
jgi:hypothetical protein